MDTILEFQGSYRFLSNFYPCEIKYDGRVWPSVEHAYQAAKTLSREEKETILKASTAGKAKRLGKLVTLRSDWEDIKIPVMSTLLNIKFSIPELKYLLLETKDDLLIEGNEWGDTFWGMCNGVGKNMLGKLLMEVRDQL